MPTNDESNCFRHTRVVSYVPVKILVDGQRPSYLRNHYVLSRVHSHICPRPLLLLLLVIGQRIGDLVRHASSTPP